MRIRAGELVKILQANPGFEVLVEPEFDTFADDLSVRVDESLHTVIIKVEGRDAPPE